MSVTIRLAKIGKKNAPTYKIVVANTSDKRNGRALDVLGFYNPALKENSYSLDKEKYDMWKFRGALITDAVQKLVAGTYEFVPYTPGAATAAKSEADTEADAEAEATESTSEAEATKE